MSGNVKIKNVFLTDLENALKEAGDYPIYQIQGPYYNKQPNCLSQWDDGKWERGCIAGCMEPQGNTGPNLRLQDSPLLPKRTCVVAIGPTEEFRRYAPVYGPYVTISTPGRYRLDFILEFLYTDDCDPGRIYFELDWNSNQIRRQETLYTYAKSNSLLGDSSGLPLISIPFDLDRTMDDFESRVLWYGQGQLKIYSIILYKVNR